MNATSRLNGRFGITFWVPAPQRKQVTVSIDVLGDFTHCLPILSRICTEMSRIDFEEVLPPESEITPAPVAYKDTQ